MSRSKFPPDNEYLEFCTDKDCIQAIETCKVCGHRGHRVDHKNDDNSMVQVIQHAHFFTDKNKGRNVFHEIAAPVYAPMERRQYTWRLK